MSLKAGALLWNRMQVTIPAATVERVGTFEVNTGLTQVNRNFADQSPQEPDLEERIQVIPMAPIGEWSLITHGEPFFDPATNTIHVLFTNTDMLLSHTINVLFWDPHTLVGPGQADPYTPPPPPK